MRRFAVVGTALLWAAAIGCGGGGGYSAPALTASDVSNIPPGTAVGTALSGVYLVTGSALTGCYCRSGSCAEFTPTQIGTTLDVTQQDGTLSIITLADGTQTPVVGGVDANDSFSVGAAVEVSASVGEGFVYELLGGQFNVAGGLPTGMTYEAEGTLTATLQGASYDCDINTSVVTGYEGPLTAALAVPAGRSAAAAFETYAGRIRR